MVGMALNLTDPIFNNESSAREHFEKIRWPDGPVCPHCGVTGDATELRGKSTRLGVYKCKACRKPFTATIGTLYERSHIPLHKWLLATHLLCSSKKGMSSHQLWRTLGFGSYRTAWFMAHRIREGMREAKLPGSMGGEGKFVVADETYVGGKAKNRAFTDPPSKEAVMALVEREGRVRSFHLRTASVTADMVKPIIAEALSTDSHFRTDESGIYWRIGEAFASHRTVNHSAMNTSVATLKQTLSRVTFRS
jgi:transposase-like protein